MDRSPSEMLKDYRYHFLKYKALDREADEMPLYQSPYIGDSVGHGSEHSDKTAHAAAAHDVMIEKIRAEVAAFACLYGPCSDATWLLDSFEDMAIINDRFINGLSYEEIAKSYGFTYDHARKRIRKALAEIDHKAALGEKPRMMADRF